MLLLLGLALAAGALTGIGRSEPTASPRIVFASNATSAFGDHIDIVAVDRRGRPRRVGDLGPGVAAARSPDERRVAFLHRDVDDDGLQLYVMNWDGSDKRQLTEEPDRPDVFDFPLVWSPDGRWIAFHRLGPTIGIAAADGSSVRYVDTGDALSPAWSPDGATIAYTTHSDDLFLANADGTNGRRVGAATSPPQWSPKGRRIAVVRDRRIWIVDPDTGEGRPLRHGAVAAHTPVWSPDGKRLAFVGSTESNGLPTNGVWTLELSTGRLTRLAGVAYDAETPAWSLDGRWLALTRERGFLRIVSSRQPGVGRTLGSWPPRRPVGAPQWLRDGRILLSTRVTENDREIFVVNANGSGARALTENEAADLQPTGSPNGRHIAYVSARRSGGKRRIYVMRSDGRGKRPLLPSYVRSQNAPAWSPTGAEIAFESYGIIYLVDSDGGSPRMLVRGYEPSWAPAGRALVFHGVFGRASGIWSINRDRTGLRRLPGFRLPSLSPDGTRLAFQQPVAYNANGIFVADLASGSERLLVAPGRDPAWSPDGTSIAFDRRFAIWTVPSGGGQATRLATTLEGIAEHARWLPASQP